MNELTLYAAQMIKQYPTLADDIRGLYRLCNDEIEEGGSEAHEIELCANSIQQLIEEEA